MPPGDNAWKDCPIPGMIEPRLQSIEDKIGLALAEIRENNHEIKEDHRDLRVKHERETDELHGRVNDTKKEIAEEQKKQSSMIVKVFATGVILWFITQILSYVIPKGIP